VIDGLVIVEMYYMGEGDDPFICGVWGKIDPNSLEDIERDCRENLEESFPSGGGSYWFLAERDEGDDLHAAYWDLTQIRYKKLEEGP